MSKGERTAETSKALLTAIKEVDGFVNDLEEGLNHKIPLSAVFDKICICGMGASAIGGDIIADLLAQSSSYPIAVIRSMDIPKWVDDKAFVIVCSYSGDTKETLSMYGQAKERGCPMAVITAGGKLKEKCLQDGIPMFPMKGGMQPRNAVGLMVGYMANIVETIGGARCKKDVESIIPDLRKFMKEIDFNSPDSYAKSIAEDLYGTVPAIYSTTGIISSTMRWQTQINENSKMLAFSGSALEFNHNEIVGWAEGNLKTICRPVFLHECECGQNKPMTDASIETLIEFGVDPLVVEIPGRTAIERCLRSIILGDYVSLYLAEMKGVDPLEVRSIRHFKEKAALLFNKNN